MSAACAARIPARLLEGQAVVELQVPGLLVLVDVEEDDDSNYPCRPYLLMNARMVKAISQLTEVVTARSLRKQALRRSMSALIIVIGRMRLLSFFFSEH